WVRVSSVHPFPVYLGEFGGTRVDKCIQLVIGQIAEGSGFSQFDLVRHKACDHAQIGFRLLIADLSDNRRSVLLEVGAHGGDEFSTKLVAASLWPSGRVA